LSLVEGEHIVGIIQEDTDWWFGTNADGTRSGLFPASYVALVDVSTEPEPEPEPETEAPPPPPPPPPPPAVPAVPEPEQESKLAPGVDEGIVAVALYECAGYPSFDIGPLNHVYFCSYDAAEDNELSFREGDRITKIEGVSDDWWSGRDQHGNVGLFPGAFFHCDYFGDHGT
jgi:hypothetical protein